MEIQAVNTLINRIGPHIDRRYDLTYPPVFPEGRSDICVVVRTAENGSSDGYDTLYLVWEQAGTLTYRALHNTRATKDYLNVHRVSVEAGSIVVAYGSGGSFSGKAWEKEWRMGMSELGLSV